MGGIGRTLPNEGKGDWEGGGGEGEREGMNMI